MKRQCCTRRSFLRKSGTVLTATGIVSFGIINCTKDSATNSTEKTIRVDITKPENAILKNIDGILAIQDPGNLIKPILIKRTGEATVIAFSSECTHKGGPVKIADGILRCEWHDAEFDTTGKVTKGPAMEDLKKYSAEIKDSIITITI